MRRVLKMVGVELVDARAAAEHQQEADDYHCAGPRHGNEVGALEKGALRRGVDALRQWFLSFLLSISCEV